MRHLKRLVLVLVLGALLVVGCQGVPEAVSPTPTEVVEPTLEPTTTPEPTATPEATPVSEPPPIIQLTVVYPDGGSFVVPIWCPVPEEFCETGLEIFDADGNYLGLGFSLPEGTPIFAVGEGSLIEVLKIEWVFDYGTGRYIYYFISELAPNTNSSRWENALPQMKFQHDQNSFGLRVHFNYRYSGFSSVFDLLADNYEFWPNGGEEIGRVNAPSSSILSEANGAVYGVDGQEIHGINFIFEVFDYCCRGKYVTLRIDLNFQPAPSMSPEPTPTPESKLKPTLTVVLLDGSEIPMDCPVPQEYCRTATEIFRDDGSFCGLGFTLPEGTPILAVADGKLERLDGGWWSPASEPQSRYYPIRYTLSTEDLSFHYSLVDDSLPAVLSATEVKAGQELGRAKYKHDKCVGRCWAKFDPFNLIFHVTPAGDMWKQPLRIRIN